MAKRRQSLRTALLVFVIAIALTFTVVIPLVDYWLRQ